MYFKQSFLHLATKPKDFYISIFAFESNEPGDLNFGQNELIEVTEANGDWFTGQLSNSQKSQKPSGIFPSSYVRKFPFPIDYIQKYTISMVVQDYVAQQDEEISLTANDLIAITKLSSDGQWSYGEQLVEQSVFPNSLSRISQNFCFHDTRMSTIKLKKAGFRQEV